VKKMLSSMSQKNLSSLERGVEDKFGVPGYRSGWGGGRRQGV